jgi:hypothetical protein
VRAQRWRAFSAMRGISLIEALPSSPACPRCCKILALAFKPDAFAAAFDADMAPVDIHAAARHAHTGSALFFFL